MEKKEKLYWDLKKAIKESGVDWINIQEILKDLSSQSVKQMACLE